MTTDELNATIKLIGDMEENQLTAFILFLGQDLAGYILGISLGFLFFILLYKAVIYIVNAASTDERLAKLYNEAFNKNYTQIGADDFRQLREFIHQHRSNNL